MIFHVFEGLVFFDPWFPVSDSGFRFPGLKSCPTTGRHSPPKQNKANEHEPPTIAKQTKVRIQPKPNKQTAKSAESIYAIKRKK